MKKYLIAVAAAAAGSVFAQAPVARRSVPSRPGVQPQPQAAQAAPASEYKMPDEPLVFDGTNNPALKFENAPSDILLQTYAEVTGKTLLMAPNLPKPNITLRSQSELTKEEYLRAIETVLVMNNIALVPDGEKFIRVFPAADLRKNGVETHFSEPESGNHTEDGKMVSQMIILKHISIEEAKKVVEGFKRNEGQIQIFERTNSILVTDTAENVNRMSEILKFVDQPIVNREETSVRPIKYAKAADIKKRLEEIIAESQKEQQQQQKKQVVESKQTGSPGVVRTTATPGGVTRPGVIRPSQQQAQPAVNNEIIETMIEDAERGVIRGKVQIVADDRTNLLIFITRPENMKFFDKIIDVLDVEVQTTPDVIVEVTRLEYATAKDVAEMLNNLIGNNTSKNSNSSDNDVQNAVSNRERGDTRSSSLSQAADNSRRPRESESKVSEKTKTKLGELKKEDVTILADERSNAIVVMASKGDVETILGIIKSMDIQLSQVVIETVIVEVSFTDTQETGMDWVQRAMVSSTSKNSTPKLAFATAGGGGSLTPRDTVSLQKTDSISSAGGVTGWFTLFDLNMDLILKAIQTDTRARLMSSPRITTMDNKEATLESTDRIYWSEGATHYTSSDYYSDNIKNEDIGIKLTVTPRINKLGYITLSVKQDIQSNPGTTLIKTSDRVSEFPLLSTRRMGAEVAVQSGETVVLGGLAQNSTSKSVSKVPILGSIPLLGWFFRSEKDVSTRTEIIVFLTPRVIDTSAQMEDDARNIKASLDTRGVWDSSWSSSRLADPLTQEQAARVLNSGKSTVAPARFPQTGYLTGLNPEIPGAAEHPVISNALENAGGKVPYVHFADLEERMKSATLTISESTVTNAPAELLQQ